MIASKMPRAVKMRPIANIEDSFVAAEILAQASSDDLDLLRAVIPAGTTQNPVQIADDGSAAAFDIYAGTDWDAHRRGIPPIARVIVRR